jgi:hypothetical protein
MRPTPFVRRGFSIYAARGRDARVAGWGSADGVLSSVDLDHGAPAWRAGPRLCIWTERQQIAYERASRLHVRECEHRASVTRAPDQSGFPRRL